jgi:hypothetical protein
VIKGADERVLYLEEKKVLNKNQKSNTFVVFRYQFS